MLDKIKKTAKFIMNQCKTDLSGFARIRSAADKLNELNSDYVFLFRKLFNMIILKAWEKNSSDIEIGGAGTAKSIWLRIDGIKKKVSDLPSLDEDEASLLILSVLDKYQQSELFEKRNLDFSYSVNNTRGDKIRFRADAYFEMETLALNLRPISPDIRPLESLGFHPMAMRFLNYGYIKNGLTLVTGITGSGKSSTLDSIIDYHNHNEPAHIIIIASPVEYVHKSDKCIIRQREVGSDVRSYPEGVVESLRQDPDIIVIGEMRDPETILAALELADTGHKVFSTLHTSSAVESLERIIAEVDTRDRERVRNRLADVLVSVISQKLLPAHGGGRVMAKEVMLVNGSIKSAIRNNNIGEIYMMVHQGAREGMMTMEQDLFRLFRESRISKKDAMAYANSKSRMEGLLKMV